MKVWEAQHEVGRIFCFEGDSPQELMQGMANFLEENPQFVYIVHAIHPHSEDIDRHYGTLIVSDWKKGAA